MLSQVCIVVRVVTACTVCVQSVLKISNVSMTKTRNGDK